MMIFTKFIPLLIFLLLLGCGQVDKSKIANLNNGRIDIIGHAGSGFLYPMLPFNPLPPNSTQSFQKALENGADGLEIDIQMSKDSVLLLFHDGNLAALEGDEGCISSFNADELVGSAFDTGFFYNWFHNEKLISLDQFLLWTSQMNRRPLLHFDIKNFDDCLGSGSKERAHLFAEKLTQAIQKHDLSSSKIIIGSSDKNLLHKAKALNRGFAIYLDEGMDFDNGLKWVLANDMQGLMIGPKIADKEKIRKAHEAGVRVAIFGGRSRSSIIKIIEMQPDAIQVNNVAQLYSLLE